MTSKPCWYCRGLPKLWWWLAALLGLPLLFFFMISDRQGPVESDLNDRVRKELIDRDVSWAEVNLAQRGRDVMLSGAAPDEAARDLAVATAEGVYGVRQVDHNIEILPLKSPELALSTDGSGITLQGLLPSQAHIDSTVAAAGEAFGADNVQNQLSVGERLKESAWLDNIGTVLPALAGWKLATLAINDDGSKISGTARSADAKDAVLQQVTTLFGDKMTDEVTVQPLQPARLATQMTDGKITLSGLLPTQQDAASLVEAAAKKLGADNIVNAIEVNDDTAAAPWLQQAQRFLGTLSPALTSTRIADDTLTLEGTANSYQAHINTLGVAQTAIAGSTLRLQDNLTVSVPAQPEAKYAVFTPPPPAGQLQARFTDDQLTLSGSLASTQEVEAIVSAASTRVGANNVINQLQVDAAHSAAPWLDNAGQLLSGLPTLQGALSISDAGAVFNGTTETREDYMRALRQARSAMQGQSIAFENNVVLDTRRLDQLSKEKAEAERLARAKAEQEQLAREQAEREKQERLAREKAEREEQERLAREKAEREEQERLARELAEREAARPSSEVIGSISEDGKLTLTGTLNNQQDVDDIVYAAATRVGADHVINQLQVDAEHKPAAWLDSAKKLVLSLPTLQGIMFINNDRATFSGTEETQQAYISAIRKARWSMQDQAMAFENKVKLDTRRLDELARLAREAARPSPAVAGIIARNGQLKLTGTLNSQQEVDAIAYAAATRVGADNVVNQLNVDAEHKPAAWLDSAKKLILSLPTLQGMMSMNNDRATFRGTEETRQDYISTVRKARWSMQNQAAMDFDNNVNLDTRRLDELAALAREAARPSGKLAGVMSADEQLTLSGTLHSEQEVAAIIDAANIRVGEDNIINQIQVDAEHKPASWLDSAKKLLISLPPLQGAMSIDNAGATFSGTTETKEDYIGTVRQGRWAMRDQAALNFANNITLDTRRLDELARMEREKAAREKQAQLARETAQRQQSCQTTLNELLASQTILFATNKAEIAIESYDLLFELASIINGCEDDLAGKKVTIGGHTDSAGQAAYNLDLSQRRADAILQYLQNAGLAPELFEAVGYGEDQPVADNESAEGRARNRRITFEIRGN